MPPLVGNSGPGILSNFSAISLSTNVLEGRAGRHRRPLGECKKQLGLIHVSVFQAGIIEEMMEDTMESLEDQDELEEDVQQEVDKVISEIMSGKISKMPAAPEASIDLPEPSKDELEPEKEEEEAEVEDDLEEMQSRLQALRS